MPELEQLEIKINAQASKANTAIDNLVTKLDTLTNRLGKINGSSLVGLANGVNRLAIGMQAFKGVGTQKFSNLADNINKLASVDSSAILRASTAMQGMARSLNGLGNISSNAVQISEVAANISKLGGVNVTRAITNLPLLTTELSKFMSVMANSPQVSRNIIDMTNALANLAGQGRSVGAATNTLTNGLNKSDKTITRTKKSTFSLARAFGKFYASYFLVIRGIKGLWSSIEKTADYFESFNYFNVAFNKIANEWSQDFEKYGYKNADAYAESFTTRMEDTFKKLSGVEFNAETGLLSETGTKNLGLNIQQITQYASQLASVTNSLELTGEASLATSQAFTKLAGDMSSLFNIDYADVSANLQSGLIGQSRALYKYGIDITNATLQTKAYELGLTKTVSEMTQGEKAQLRLLSILEQSKIAWGDQANTINSLSNQVRVLKNGWAEMGMTFGQLFVPLMEGVLPVINGIVIALKNLFSDIAGFMGIEIDPNKYNTGLNENEDILEGITDGYEDATAAAEEYKNQLLSFDEVTKLQDTTANVGVNVDGNTIDLTGQILGATSEYEKAWQDAYVNMEDKASKFAKKVSKALSPIKNIFKNIAIGDWFSVGEDVSKLTAGIFNFATKAISNVDWSAVGKSIGEFFKGINWTEVFSSVGNFVDTAVGAAIELWKSAFDADPIATTIVTALGLAKFTGLGGILTDKIKGALGTKINLGTIVAIAAISWDVGWRIGNWIYEAISGEEVKMTPGEQMEYLLNSSTEEITYALGRWWEDNIEPFFDADTWMDLSIALTGDIMDLLGIDKDDGPLDVILEWMFGYDQNTLDHYKRTINKFIDYLNEALEPILSFYNDFAIVLYKTAGVDLPLLKKIPKLEINNPSAFATGGFPEDGLFYANHNELVGRFSNGKTAVANNSQITEGIAQAVGPAVYSAVKSAMATNGNNSQPIKVYVGDRELSEIAIDGINDKIRTTGVNPLYT